MIKTGQEWSGLVRSDQDLLGMIRTVSSYEGFPGLLINYVESTEYRGSSDDTK